ncbi:hypothetical protein [Cylindrospermopsis raciborskii]|uniref:Uncharacterized protein n=1 Tax=Cylindrospermopsis raciborskii CS-505 TaxID=533240 RepID=A0A853M8C8_9CYAN|nr:hypothetical protein [Cylindrospermopsis raciborskii]OBU74802.1 hypothetical protein A9P98_17685 [Cylindrospermopsis raciborskii CS-505]
MLKGDCEALATRDRSHLGTFHVQFPFGKTLTVNVFRQRINQLFQGVEDIWRGIAKHALGAIALSDYPPVSSQGKNLNILKGDREAFPKGDRIQEFSPDSFSRENSEYVEGRSHCTPFGRSLLDVIPRFLLKGKLEHTEGRLRSTPYGRSLSSRHISCSVPVRENIDGKRFPSKDKSVISRG